MPLTRALYRKKHKGKYNKRAGCWSIAFHQRQWRRPAGQQRHGGVGTSPSKLVDRNRSVRKIFSANICTKIGESKEQRAGKRITGESGVTVAASGHTRSLCKQYLCTYLHTLG